MAKQKTSRYTDTVNYFNNIALSDSADEELKSYAKSAVFFLRKYGKYITDKTENERLMNGNCKWTEEEETKLVERYRKGKSVESLAKLHHRTASGIIARLTMLGELSDDGASKKRWTEEEEEKLCKEYASGKSLAKMAAAHGRSIGGINSRLILLGLVEE